MGFPRFVYDLGLLTELTSQIGSQACFTGTLSALRFFLRGFLGGRGKERGALKR